MLSTPVFEIEGSERKLRDDKCHVARAALFRALSTIIGHDLRIIFRFELKTKIIVKLENKNARATRRTTTIRQLIAIIKRCFSFAPSLPHFHDNKLLIKELKSARLIKQTIKHHAHVKM